MSEGTPPAEKTIWRHFVPVDDRWHEVSTSSAPLAAAAAYSDTAVEFWAERTDRPARPRLFRVFGTGHLIPSDATWRATCLRGPSGLVWHLYEAGASVAPPVLRPRPDLGDDPDGDLGGYDGA